MDDLQLMEYPILAIVGERGDGKTLTATALGYLYHIVDNQSI